MEFTAKIQRLPKGKFAFGGVVDFKYDVDETTIVCIVCYLIHCLANSFSPSPSRPG